MPQTVAEKFNTSEDQLAALQEEADKFINQWKSPRVATDKAFEKEN